MNTLHHSFPRTAHSTCQVLGAIALLALLLAVVGCDGGVESAATADNTTTSSPEQWQFTSPQAFVEYVQQIDDDEVRVSIFDHMYARSHEEKWAVAQQGKFARHEREYRAAIFEQFGDAAIDVIGEQMQAIALPTSTDNVTIEPHGETRVLVQFPGSDALDTEILVLANIRGAWAPHATSITDGNEVETRWCSDARRAYFNRSADAYTTITDAVRSGRYTQPRQAQQALTARLAELKRQFIPGD